MGDRMYVTLVVGPVTGKQKASLPEVMADFFRDLGMDYPEPEMLENDPSRVRFTLEEINYGLQTLGTEPGRLEFLIESCLPYRVTDDGGAYANGTDAIWSPAFGDLPPLLRQANSSSEVVITEHLVERLEPLNDQAFGKVMRGLMKTDPADPMLLESYRLVRSVLDNALDHA